MTTDKLQRGERTDTVSGQEDAAPSDVAAVDTNKREIKNELSPAVATSKNGPELQMC